MKKFLLPALAAIFIFTAGCKKQDIKRDDTDSLELETVAFTYEPSVR